LLDKPTTMIQPRSIVKIADNSGGQIGRIFKVLGSSKKRYAYIGDTVILSVQKAAPRKGVKKKDVLRAVVVRQRTPFRRKDGSYIRFDENAVVILEKEKNEPIAGRVFGPIPREIGEMNFQTIISRAPEVV
jgi:large subunit ribosomal protein L14